MYQNELYHHGILGMKWGKRNGPPYPLGSSDHSASEKKAGWRKSLDSGKEEAYNKKHKLVLSDKQKIAIKIGIAVAATALIAYGGYKLAKNENVKEAIAFGKERADILFGGSINTSATVGVGKSIDQIDRRMVSKINGSLKQRLTMPHRLNCAHTSVSYILNSVFGMNTTAKGYYGVDEVSGMVIPSGRNVNVFKSIFNGIKETNFKLPKHFADALRDIPNGSTGVLFIRAGRIGHYVCYEKAKDGLLSIIDPQQNKRMVMDIFGAENQFPFHRVQRVIDCTNATLRDDAKNVLKYMVNM